MFNLYTIASPETFIRQALEAASTCRYSMAYQARPGMVLPIIIRDQGRLKMIEAKWCHGNESSDLKSSVGMGQVLARHPYKILVRKQRCVVLSNCFFGTKKANPYLVRVLDHRLFGMGAVYHEERTSQGVGYSFTLLHTDPADVLAPLTRQMPVVMTMEQVEGWLAPGPLHGTMEFADMAREHWFDYFQVSDRVLSEAYNDKSLLQPVGLSREELRKRERALMALKLDKERADRMGGKR